MSLSLSNSTRALCLGLLCLLLASCLPGRTQVVRGVLHGPLLWQGEVLIAGDVILEKDVQLTIMPGTRVRFLPAENSPGGLVDHPYFSGSELIIKGRLHAVGTADEPIIFEAFDPLAPAGAWGALNFEESPEAVLEYCLFRQAESAVHSRDSQIYIEQSIFEENLVAIRFNNSPILIEHNLLRNNHTAIRFHFGSPVICENEFQGNKVNLFVTSHPADYRIENNTFGAAAEYQVVFGEEVPDDVVLSHNFWGVFDAAARAEAFYDGQRASYLGRVLIDPVRQSPATLAGVSWSP